MDEAIVENARLVLHFPDIPAKFVRLASSLYTQSISSIPLKPNQEPARVHICCVLAADQVGERLGLPEPDIKKPPIPPAQYAKLLQQFRSVLGGQQTPQRTPQKRVSPKRVSSVDSTPSRQTRAARRKISDLQFDEYDDDDDDFADEELASPCRQVPVPTKISPRKPSTSPSKSRKKQPAPTSDQIEALAAHMGLNPETTEAIMTAYSQFSELVKDEWGLAYGLLAVVAARAEPKEATQHERRLVRALAELQPRVEVDQAEWVAWTRQIVTGQSWIMQVADSEPQPELVGSPGGWFPY